MLGNGSDEFLGGIYLEVLPAFAFSHPSVVDDFVGLFYKVDLLDVEDVTYDVPSNVFPSTLMGKHLEQWLPCRQYLPS